jgi:hypothetical protein
LNNANKLFDDGRTLVDEDWLERGRNREAYGDVQAAIATAAGTNTDLAARALREAIANYERSRLATSEDFSRTRLKLKNLAESLNLQSP